MFRPLFPGARHRSQRQSLRRRFRRRLGLEPLELRRVLAAVVVVESGGSTDLIEGGLTDDYTLSLDMVPAGNVELTVTADAETEVSANGVDFFASLVLDFADMTPQTVTVRAVDDALIDGPHVGMITHAVTATGDAANYPLTTVVPAVAANITDNDATTVSVDGAGDLIVSDPTDHDDSLTLVISGANLRVSDPTTPITAGVGATQVDANTVEAPVAAITGANGVVVLANGGDDTLTVDLSGGNFPVLVDYQGGANVTGDQLSLVGGGVFPNVTHNFANASDGTVVISGNQPISYQGLEPILDNLDAMNRVFTFSAVDETITLGDDADANDGESQVDSTAGEIVTFTNPTVSLTVNGGAGAETFDLNALDTSFAASLVVNGETGEDLFNVSTDPGAASTTLDGGPENDRFVFTSAATSVVVGGSGDDILAVQGDGSNNLLHLPDAATAGSGVLSFDAQPISFSGVERSELANAATATLQTPNGNDDLTLTNGTDLALGGTSPTIDVTGTSAGVDIATVAFSQIGLLTVDTTTVDGTDQITVSSADAIHQIQDLTLSLGANGDTVSLDGAIAVSGVVTIASNDADINDNADAAVDISAMALTTTAATFGDGGADNAIDTAVQSLAVDTSAASGDQFIREADALESIDLDAGGGNVTLVAGGSVDDTDGSTDVAAASLLATVVGGIGGAAGLDTELTSLTIASSAAGSCIDVHIDNNQVTAGPLTVDQATSAGGCDVLISNVGNTAANEGVLIDGTVAAAGSGANVVIESNSPLIVNNNRTVSADAAVTLTAAETALAGDDLTVRSNAAVQSTNGDITISAGDNITLESGSSVRADLANDGLSPGQLMILGDEGNDNGAVIQILGSGFIGAAGGTMIRGNGSNDVVALQAERLRSGDDFSVNLRAGADVMTLVLGADSVSAANSLVINADDGADDGQVDLLTFNSTADTAARRFLVEYDNNDGTGQFSRVRAEQAGMSGTTIDVNRVNQYRFLGSAGIPAAETNVLSLAGETGVPNQFAVGNIGTGQLFETALVNCIHVLGQEMGDVVDLSQALATTDSLISVGGGADDVTGTPGRDVIFGGTGADVLRGGPGDDFLFADHTLDQSGNFIIPSIVDGDMLFGGLGTDSAVSFGADTIAEIEGDLFVSGAIVDVIAWLRARFIFDGNGATVINDALSLACPAFVLGNGIHQAALSSTGGSPEGEAPLQNPVNNLDVNADGTVASGDALAVVNLLNSFGSAQVGGEQAEGEAEPGTLYYDVNGDNHFSPVDVLHVINHLNDPAVAEGESTMPTVRWIPRSTESQVHSQQAAEIELVEVDPRDVWFEQLNESHEVVAAEPAAPSHYELIALDEELLGVLSAK